MSLKLFSVFDLFQFVVVVVGLWAAVGHVECCNSKWK